MAVNRIAVTGGNGKIGKALIKELNNHDYETVSISRGKSRHDEADEFRSVNLLDAGEVYGALAISDADAVVHTGTIPHPSSHPGYVTYESNVMSSFIVLEAAIELGLESIVIASSINIMGAEYQNPTPEVEYLPINEEHPLTPRDPYGISKHAVEISAEGVSRRASHDIKISCLRYPWVPTTDEIIETFVEADRSLDGLLEDDPVQAESVLFSYLHIDDAVSIARRAIEAEYDGYHAFWAAADDTSAEVESQILAETFYPEANGRELLKGYDSLIDTQHAAEVLDWQPKCSWRDFE